MCMCSDIILLYSSALKKLKHFQLDWPFQVDEVICIQQKASNVYGYIPCSIQNKRNLLAGVGFLSNAPAMDLVLFHSRITDSLSQLYF